ncbi:hypothetical protein EV182_004442 [Spiromyces aspiralis]|uniref:Uncharacterized protein n=1 Tax=Spiromyces aspiralis TaxID=68401 RepID=A0ACC1HBA0_9FUNG|nr:hypothetical protein EV182_004442 [Spiromyces aspiralis]
MNDRSFVIELLEMPAGFPDEVTLDYHFEQLASDNEAKEFAILEREVVPDTHKPDLSDVKVLTAVGSQTIAKFNESEKSADAYNTVVIFIAVVRIPKHMTDVIITLNCPVKIGSGSSSAVMVEHVATNLTEVRDTFQHIVRSFKVHDWSLLSSQ